MPNSLAQQLRHLVEDPRLKSAGDADLLRRFTAEHDQAAFRVLVDRHGPMVLHVCRCVLRDAADIDDAFQATFLILARRAGSIRKTGSLSCWLHGVAHRTALKALQRSSTRRKHEAAAPVRDATASDDWSWREVQAILHEEVETLPERYRCPLVLCYLEGKTQEQAATALGLVKGTLRRRLDRARELLRARLVRRGLGPAALALAVTWPGMHAAGAAAAPAALAASTAHAAGLLALGQTTAHAASAAVAGLVEGVLQTMAMTKVKAAAVALTVALLLGVVGTAVLDGLPTIAAAPGLPGSVPSGPRNRAADRDKSAGHAAGRFVQATAAADGPAPAAQSEPSATIDRFVAHLKKPRLRRFAGEQTLGLFLMDLEKRDVTLIAADVDAERAYCGSPSWSCDGRRILFDASPGMAFSKTRLQMLELTDAGPGLSSFGPGNCPTISPDGKRIAYLLNSGALANAEQGIYVMDADGTSRRLLTRASGVPKWSPQGNKLLIADFNNPTSLTLLDVDTAKQSAIRFPGRIYSRPSWVDEQTLVAFIGEARTMSVALLDVSRPDDVRVRKVLWRRGDGANVEPLYPVYSPVTKQCLFVGREKGVQSLYRLDRNGRPQRLEAQEQRDGKIASLALSPDGRYLLFCSDRAFNGREP